MAFKTFGELQAEVQADLDLEAEEFINGIEFQNYFNSGIRRVEAEIIKLGLREQYLKDEAFVSTVQGQKDYALPTDIIDTKIRKIVFRDGTNIYTVHPIRGESSYEEEDIVNITPSATDRHAFDIIKTSSDWVLRLVPTPTKAVANALRILYFKDLNRFTASTDECDVPEYCYEYLLSYVRYRCYKKEGHPNTLEEKEELGDHLITMRETLQGQISDPDIDLVDKDFTHYEEMN